MVGFTRDQILAIGEPERLFVTAEDIAATFKLLAKHWHPDTDTGDAEVFAHINVLHQQAKQKVAIGEWHIPGLLELTGTEHSDGIKRKIKYLKEFDCGLGRAYIGRRYVTYVISDDYADLFHDAKRQLEIFKYPNDKERDQLAVCLPKIRTSFTATDKLILIVTKPDDTIRLRDLLAHVGGKIHPTHVAWIVNRLLNLVNFLAFNKITHGDLSLDSIFVSPERHSIALIGGWWYTMPLGSRMARVQPARTLAYAPRSILTSKIADIKLDLELVRLIGRELLGDETGIKLRTDKSIPPAMVEWLRSVTTGDPIVDYTRWPEVLRSSFGERKFVKWDININEIYQEFKNG
jgi:hypothetical protein